MRCRQVLLAAAVALPVLCAPPRDPLEAGFADPPPEARLRCYWWWLNGNTDEAAITRDLEQMRAKGYDGALLVDANGSEQQRNRMVPAGPMFGTARWRELYRHALKEAGGSASKSASTSRADGISAGRM
ncbi:MAG TPA: glycosyl hydrolase [Candidatus Acidoferrales bacterium]|nr:glycosyl hydrolase [Candidatus Acidoferrales bacterium]